MGFSLWNLIKATILVLNAAAVLNEKFCLSKYGLDKPDDQTFGPARSPLKSQIYGLLFASRYLRVPLIGLNSVVIVVEMLF